jgi:hypothetical protein
LDNFRNFDPVEVFSSGMSSQPNEDNFQSNITGMMEIYTGEKRGSKFYVFQRNNIFGTLFISAYSPFLDEAKYISFSHVP